MDPAAAADTADTPAPTQQHEVFRCKPPEASPAGQVLACILVGVLVGAVGWYEVDRTMTVAHIAGWLAGCIALIAPLAWLITRNPVVSITIDDAGLTVERARRPLRFAWSEIEAARFQDYDVHGGETIRCLLLRARGESFELTPEFGDDDATREAFEDAIARECDERDIPETSGGLPSFQRTLSLAGAWLFAASIAGTLAAHLVGYHTLGTIIGLALLFTGSVLAWMTRSERTSRIVLAATVLLIVGGVAILWACHVNVREVLNKWEQSERAR